MVIREGDWISLNGTKGQVYEGSMALVDIDIDKNQSYKDLMLLVDKVKQIGVRANCETPEDATHAVKFGAEGIGLNPVPNICSMAKAVKHLCSSCGK